MGEIDTKPIESVQAAISLFGEMNDQMKNRSAIKDELEKEKELQNIMNDYANIKMQLEAKDCAYKQSLLKLEHYHKTAEELSALLKSSELEKDVYINEIKEARDRVNQLESTVKDMADQLLASANIREQLSPILTELRATEGQLLRLDEELLAENDAKFESMKHVEILETSLSMEKLQTEELLRHISELNETIMHLKLTADEAEREKYQLMSARELEIQLAEAVATESEERLLSVTKRLEIMHNLENQLLEKSLSIESLQLELSKANDLHSSSEKIAFDAISEVNQLKADLELKEGKISNQAGYMNSLETELKEIKLEFNKANEEMDRLTRNAEEMQEELENTRRELIEARKEETEAQIEIALLKSELHKGRSLVAAAAAAEERAKSEKSAVYIALQQLAIEAEEAKKENRQLKEADKIAEESESSSHLDLQQESSAQYRNIPNIDSKSDSVEVTISKEEYEVLVKKAERGDQNMKLGPQSENLQKELELATSKIAEFRTRAEQAITRAEVAEKAKAALEEKIKKWKEHRAKKKAALVTFNEESTSKEINSLGSTGAPKVYQPLGNKNLRL